MRGPRRFNRGLVPLLAAAVLGALVPTAASASTGRSATTAAPTVAASTAPSGQPGDFVFQGEDGIYLVHADGTGLTFLTPGAAPVWSPDGRQIAYEGDNGIWLMTIGQPGRFLTTGYEPAWSPDGSMLAFSKITANGFLDVFWIAASGGPVHRITYSAGRACSARAPAWSSLGTIAFVRAYSGTDACTSGILETGLGAGRSRMVVKDITAADPSFTADGRHLLYLADCPVDNGNCSSNGYGGWEATAAGTHRHVVLGNYECEEGEPCLRAMVAAPGVTWIDARTDRDAQDVRRTCYQGRLVTGAGIEPVAPAFCVSSGDGYKFSVRAATS